MNKAKTKSRDIHFWSEKNGKVMCVHTAAERAYARELEESDFVLSYETGVALEPERYAYVNPIDIRKDYFKTDWTTDFAVHFEDGTTGIRELVSIEGLAKRAEMEKLEFSRRYWALENVANWKIVIMEKGEGADVL